MKEELYPSPDDITKRAKQIIKHLEKIRKKHLCAIVFVDLVGSTAYKDEHPLEEDWLTRLSFFMQSITEILAETGEVVKYIGDEIMAAFKLETSPFDAVHAAIKVLLFCRNCQEYDFNVKIAMDWGEVSFLDFTSLLMKRKYSAVVLPGDPQGLVVDRCSRIAKKCRKNTILCSKEFRDAHGNTANWRSCGSFKAKGIKKRVVVYQLRDTNPTVEKVQITNNNLTLEECIAKNKALEEKISEISSHVRSTK